MDKYNQHMQAMKDAEQKLNEVALEVIEQLRWATTQGTWHMVNTQAILDFGLALSRLQEGQPDAALDLLKTINF